MEDKSKQEGAADRNVDHIEDVAASLMARLFDIRLQLLAYAEGSQELAHERRHRVYVASDMEREAQSAACIHLSRSAERSFSGVELGWGLSTK